MFHSLPNTYLNFLKFYLGILIAFTASLFCVSGIDSVSYGVILNHGSGEPLGSLETIQEVLQFYW